MYRRRPQYASSGARRFSTGARSARSVKSRPREYMSGQGGYFGRVLGTIGSKAASFILGRKVGESWARKLDKFEDAGYMTGAALGAPAAPLMVAAGLSTGLAQLDPFDLYVDTTDKPTSVALPAVVGGMIQANRMLMPAASQQSQLAGRTATSSRGVPDPATVSRDIRSMDSSIDNDMMLSYMNDMMAGGMSRSDAYRAYLAAQQVTAPVRAVTPVVVPGAVSPAVSSAGAFVPIVPAPVTEQRAFVRPIAVRPLDRISPDYARIGEMLARRGSSPMLPSRVMRSYEESGYYSPISDSLRRRMTGVPLEVLRSAADMYPRPGVTNMGIMMSPMRLRSGRRVQGNGAYRIRRMRGMGAYIDPFDDKSGDYYLDKAGLYKDHTGEPLVPIVVPKADHDQAIISKGHSIVYTQPFKPLVMAKPISDRPSRR